MVIILGKAIIVMGGFVLEASLDEMNNIGISSAHNVESSDLWHARLGHVNVASIKMMK
jgi:hypothetical protein